MNTKRFILASIAVFVAYEIIDSIVHALILCGTYETLKDIWRPDMEQKMWIMYIAVLFFSFLFVYIFTKGYENKGIAEGIRYGLLIGLLINIGMFYQYVVYPLPLTLVVQWFIYGMIQYIICGIIASIIYKPIKA